MDPLSHIALGRTLAALRPRAEVSRGLTAAAVLGALAPDVDAVMMPFGWDRYLRVHEIGTHALAGAALVAVLTAAAVRLWDRATPARRLAAFAAMGVASHLVLDLLSGARIRLAWPLAAAHVSWPIVGMADPILMVPLVAAVAAVALTRARRRPTAAIALAAIAALVAAKTGAGLVAAGHYREAAGATAVARVVEARWASPTAWHVFDRTPDRLRVWLADAATPGASLLFEWPAEPETAVVTASRRLSTVRNFLHSHALGFAAVWAEDNGGHAVLWSDIRYCWNPDEPGAPAAHPVAVARSGRRLACGLWFGGEFDAASRAVREVVRVGAWTQTRPPQ
jgi:membrane-bound metal-dependent hydrolase YbcI (DUF457 family)